MYACAYIHVKGIVQGVGFRYFAAREARSLHLNGYVRNCMDGSVESEVEGTQEFVQDYIQAMQRGSAFSKVTAVDVKWEKYQNKYKEFKITY
jgi:acylphosphatase